MDFHFSHLIVIALILFPQAKAEATGAVFFIDSSSHQYFRSPSPEDAVQPSSMLLPEVGAAVSVLLGCAPPSTLSPASSSKLNGVLKPNPFERPRAVFALEIQGINDPKLVLNPNNALFSSAIWRKVNLDSERADIQLPGEDEVSVASLDESVADYTVKDVVDFASWMGGSYVADALKPINGVLRISLPNGVDVNFNLSKEADRKFVASLLCLYHNVRRAINIHADLSQSMQSPAELISGSFEGLKAMQEKYESEEAVQHGAALLFATLSQIFHSLQEAYRGQIVGVIFSSGTPLSESGQMMNVVSTHQPTPRWLLETEKSRNSFAEVILVRTTLAWLTGIILLIATLLGVLFLLNMPLTRDTLLYSNVKLD